MIGSVIYKPVMLAVSGVHALGWGLWLSGMMQAGWMTYALCSAMGLATAGLTLSWAAAGEASSAAAATA